MKKKGAEKGSPEVKTKHKILIGVADDHIQTAINLASFLESNGYQTFQAYNTQNAIELALKEKPSILILDLGHDGLDGYEVAKSLPNQKIIFMSLEKLENTEVAKFKNVVGFVPKPVDNDKLLKLIKIKI